MNRRAPDEETRIRPPRENRPIFSELLLLERFTNERESSSRVRVAWILDQRQSVWIVNLLSVDRPMKNDSLKVKVGKRDSARGLRV